MKVLRDIQFTFTEEEVCAIILKHLRGEGELPEMEKSSFDRAGTSLMYSEQDDVYKFDVNLEKGSVDVG